VLTLGFDTATRATSVALWSGDGAGAGHACDRARGGVTLERRDDPPPGSRPNHTTRLMTLIVEAMDAAGRGWEDLSLIAVGTGPGTFTGLRIGVATARALATARSLPLIGVSTLAALASGTGSPSAHGDGDGDGNGDGDGDGDGDGVAADGAEGVLAVLDARRGEVFAAGWDSPRDVLGPPVLAARAVAPKGLADAVARTGRRWLAVGDGAVEFRSVLERSGVRIPEDDSLLHRVSAIEHCRLAQGLRPESPGEVRPQYLRLPDAELALRATRPS
jgi:tRNA threonylcarbamoyladenosine biosynthesis protein TsaB